MDKKTIIILAFACLVGIGGWYLIKQENLTMQVLENEISILDSKKKDLEDANKTLENQKDFKRKYAAESVMEKLEQILPKDPGHKDILAQLYTIAKEKSVKIEEVNLAPEAESGKIRITEDETEEKKEYDFPDPAFNIKIFGKYSNIKTFIEKIEKNSRVMDIASIIMAIDDEDKEEASEPTLSADIKIRIYYKS